jgi:O-antigen/teichoic acid export membrane protein
MRTKFFIINSISTALLQIVTLVAGFIIPRIMLTSYGSEINGLVNSISQFISYFNLIEAGLSGAAVYALYKPLATKNYNEVNSILAATKNFYFRTGFYFLGLVIILSISYPIFVKTSFLTSLELGILVVILGCSGVIDFFLMAKYRVLLTATQRVYVLSIASICYICLNTSITAVLAYFKVDIIILKAIVLSAVFVRSIILYVYVKKNYRYVSYNVQPNEKALNRRWDALYLQVLGSINQGIPIVVATLFTSLSLVSVYSIYNLIINGVIGMLSIFTNSLFSSFGDVIAKNEQKILQKAYREFEFFFYTLLSWCFACTSILIMPFIDVYTQGINDAQYYNPLLGLLFVINGIFYCLKNPQGMLVISAGLYKETRIQVTIQGLLAVILPFIFVQFWGLEGIIIGMIISNLYRTIDLLFFIPRTLTKLKVIESFNRMVRVCLVIAVCYIPSLFFRIEVTNVKEWFEFSGIVSVYCLVITVLVNYICDRQLFGQIVMRIRGLRNRM